MKKFYITTPIFYPNANLHLGHAYTTTLCDALARYHRLIGEETYLLTGSDENTEKLVRAAEKEGRDPKEYLDSVIENFKSLFSDLEISYDQFIRTSDEENHWPGVREFWQRLEKAGDLEKRSYEGLYCVGHESFITEKELVDGKCPEHGEVPQKLKEENYFFKLSKYTEKIKEKINNDDLEIIPETRKNEILALLDRGLEDVSFSRPADKMKLGIPVPGDPSQKIYVWGDALTNYITALGFGSEKSDSLFKKLWPADFHVIGKDILRFHAAIWPGMLLSAGIELPKRILVHGFITSEGKKMSKTLGNVIDPKELIEEYGAEAVRYYLLRHISPFEDGDITKESFKEAYNANLANGLGNLTSRILGMSKNFPNLEFNEDNLEIPNEFHKYLTSFQINKAMDHIWGVISYLDGLIQNKQPFKLIKEDPKLAQDTMLILLNTLYIISKMLEPFLPETSEKIKSLIKQNKAPESPLFPRKD